MNDVGLGTVSTVCEPLKLVSLTLATCTIEFVCKPCGRFVMIVTMLPTRPAPFCGIVNIDGISASLSNDRVSWNASLRLLNADVPTPGMLDYLSFRFGLCFGRRFNQAKLDCGFPI